MKKWLRDTFNSILREIKPVNDNKQLDDRKYNRKKRKITDFPLPLGFFMNLERDITEEEKKEAIQEILAGYSDMLCAIDDLVLEMLDVFFSSEEFVDAAIRSDSSCTDKFAEKVHLFRQAMIAFYVLDLSRSSISDKQFTLMNHLMVFFTEFLRLSNLSYPSFYEQMMKCLFREFLVRKGFSSTGFRYEKFTVDILPSQINAIDRHVKFLNNIGAGLLTTGCYGGTEGFRSFKKKREELDG